MTQNRVLIISIIVLVILALGAVITILLNNRANRNASLTQTTASPSASDTEELTSGDSNEEIQTDLNNTVLDETDQDLKQVEQDIKSL